MAPPPSDSGEVSQDPPAAVTHLSGNQPDPAHPPATLLSPTSHASSASTQPLAPLTNASGHSTKPKRRKTTTEQFNALIAVFKETDTPNYEARECLSKQLGMSVRDVQVWFQNRRAKVNRERQNQAAAAVAAHHSRTGYPVAPRGGRYRSQSDCGSSMAFQFVPIVSCDKSKTGAAMSQSLRGYRNHHQYHPPPIAPHPRAGPGAPTGTHQPPHSPYSNPMQTMVPPSYAPLTPTPGTRRMAPAPVEGPMRNRRGSHTLSPTMGSGAAPYVVPSTQLSPIAPAFNALSLSPSQSASIPQSPLRGLRTHRPSPLPLASSGSHHPWQSPAKSATYPTPGPSSPRSPAYPSHYHPLAGGSGTVPFPHLSPGGTQGPGSPLRPSYHTHSHPPTTGPPLANGLSTRAHLSVRRPSAPVYGATPPHASYRASAATYSTNVYSPSEYHPLPQPRPLEPVAEAAAGPVLSPLSKPLHHHHGSSQLTDSDAMPSQFCSPPLSSGSSVMVSSSTPPGQLPASHDLDPLSLLVATATSVADTSGATSSELPRLYSSDRHTCKLPPLARPLPPAPCYSAESPLARSEGMRRNTISGPPIHLPPIHRLLPSAQGSDGSPTL
ncbi:hypothetical protein H4R35_006446 [Dimargaris xerosporica]|nr:hypothetical protein H4R35_006446 [Dimargaris xerosporica]